MSNQIDIVINRYIIKPIYILGIIILSFFMLLTVADVLLRYIFHHPLLGSIEIIKASMVVICFLVLAWTTLEKGHVRADTIFNRLPSKAQQILNVFFHFLYASFFIIVTLSFIKEIIYRFEIMEKTVSLNIPVYLIFSLASLGLLITSFVIVYQLIVLIGGMRK
jgi:TRAP-type C4-dicarboxylate transport system permease small subunit